MSTPDQPRIALVIALVSFFFALSACDSSTPSNNNNPPVTDVLSSVQIEGTQASLVNEAFPTGGSGASPTVEGGTQIVRGGSILLAVTPSSSADHMLIGLTGDISGYFNAAIPASNALPGTSQSRGGDVTIPIVVTSNSSSSVVSFTLLVASQSGNSISSSAQYLVTVNTDAETSGQIQVSLNWDAPADLDLHVETPDGEDIYYGNTSGTNGGLLDLDSNAGCTLDRVDNENISWGTVVPEAGEYTVRVDLWSACEVTSSMPFVVTTNVRGVVRTFTGTFEPSDADNGGANEGRIITQFQFSPANP